MVRAGTKPEDHAHDLRAFFCLDRYCGAGYAVSMNRLRYVSFLTAIWLLLGAGALFADQLFAAATPEVTNLRALYREAGIQFPSDSFPLSKRDLYSYAVWLRAQTRNGSIASQASAYITLLDYQRVALKLDMNQGATFQYYNTSTGQPLSFADKVAYIDPLVQASWYFGADGGPSFFIQASLIPDYTQDLNTNLPIPQAGKPLAFDNNFIRQGYLYVPFGFGDLTFGRQQLQIGPSELLTGLTISERLPFFDALRARIFLGRFTLTEIVATLENRQSTPDVTIPGTPDPSYAFGNNIIFYNIHYFEYSWSHIRAGIGAQMVISRPYNMFNFGDFFPVFSWHQGDIAVNNMCLIGDVSATPFPGIDVYLQGGFDAFNTNGIGVFNLPIPTIWAYLIGIRRSGDILGMPTEATLEWGSTHYLWGNYSWAGDVGENVLSRSIYRLHMDVGSNGSLPLTSPYGPGSNWLIAQLKGKAPHGFSGELRATMLQQNTQANLYTTTYADDPAVANAPYTTTFIFEATAGWSWRNIVDLSVNPQIFTESGTTWFRFFLSVNVHYDNRQNVKAEALQTGV